MPKLSTSQLTLDFEPGLTERHASLLECVKASVYGSSKAFKAIASEMDLSQSDLSRKLAGNPDDPRRFTVEDLERVIAATGDTRPVLWLIERFLQDPEAKRARAAAELARLLPELIALSRAAGGGR